MKRSVGITISAVIAFLGSGAVLLLGTSAFLIVPASQPQFLKYGTYFLGVLLVGFATWGIASGVGLLRLREWARVSLLRTWRLLTWPTLWHRPVHAVGDSLKNSDIKLVTLCARNSLD
jgi:hypothetical protein